MADERLFGEGVDRDAEEVVAAGAGELGEVLLGLVGELEVGAGELVPGAPADRDAAATRDRGDAAAIRLSTAGLRDSPAPGPSASPRAARSGAAPRRGAARGDPGEQDQQHRDALVDRRLVGEVVGEAVRALHGEHRRQRPQRADRQRREQPEAVPGEGDQAAGATSSASSPPRE